MKNTIALLAALLVSGLLTSCGKPVPQNQVCLVLRTLGDRTAPVADPQTDPQANASAPAPPNPAEEESAGHKRMRENILTANAELVYARRAPLDTPAVVLLFFELGKHAYKFSMADSFESPPGEQFVIDCIGGKVNFDFTVHMYIDRTLPDLKERLLMLAQDYQLRQYDGSANVLGNLVEDRMPRIIREPLQDYCTSRNPMTIIEGKTTVNALTLEHLNKTFGKYGIKFTLAAISSSVRLDKAQQEQMNGILTKEYERAALELQTGPDGQKALEQKISVVTESALTEVANRINVANATTVQLVSEANKRRRTSMIGLIGQDSYVELETLMTMVRNLETGSTKIGIVPSSSQIWLSTPVK